MRRLVPAVLCLCACGHGAGTLAPADSPTAGAREREAARYVSPAAYEHYIRAQLATLSGSPEDAVDELRRALVSDGASPWLHARLGEELFALGRLDEARDELTQALHGDPEFPAAQVDLGRVLLSLGDAAAAEASFRRAFAIDRAYEPAYLALAALYQERGDARAADVYRALGDSVPASAIAHYQLAHAASRRGDDVAAEAELRRALALDDAMVDACRELGLLEVVAARVDQGLATLNACLERTNDPGVARALVIVETANGHADRASALLEKMAVSPSSNERRIAIGELLVESHLGPRALLLVDALVKQSPSIAGEPAVLLLRGGALAESRRRDEALAVLRRVPATAPEYTAARLHVARLLLEDGRFREAAAELDRAAQDGDKLVDNDRVIAALADAHERAGDYAQATRVLDAARRAHPASELLLLAAARVRDHAGDHAGALAALRAQVARRPESVDAQHVLARVLADRGDAASLTEAASVLERALTLRPIAGELADSLGLVYLRLGQATDAERLLHRAQRLLGDSPEVLAHLGELSVARGDRPHALDLYHRALARRPDERLRRTLEEQVQLLESGRVGSR